MSFNVKVTDVDFLLHRAWHISKQIPGLENVVQLIEGDTRFKDDIKKVRVRLVKKLKEDERPKIPLKAPQTFLETLKEHHITRFEGNNKVLYAMMMGLQAMWRTDASKERWSRYECFLKEAIRDGPGDKKAEQKYKALTIIANDIVNTEPRLREANWIMDWEQYLEEIGDEEDDDDDGGETEVEG